MHLHAVEAGKPQLHPPGQGGFRAEGLPVDEVGPAANNLPQQQPHYRQIPHGKKRDLMALRVNQRHNDAYNHRAVNGQPAVPDPSHSRPVQAAVRSAVEIQIEQHIVEPGADDAAGQRPEHHIHYIVLRQAVVFGLLHAEVQPRQHGDGQNNPVPVDSVADMDGHRVNVQFPVPKQAGKADGHIFHCAHSRYFLSAAGTSARRICYCKRRRAFSASQRIRLSAQCG